MPDPPTMTSTHPSKVPLARASAAVTLLGALLLVPISILHPQGNDAEAVNSLGSWTLLHALGAFGLGLIAVGAVLRLALGPASPVTAAGFAAMAVFGTLLALQLSIDGFLNQYFADQPGLEDTSLAPALDAFVEVERGIATLAFGGFGLAGVAISLSQLRAGPVLMRIGRGIASLAFLAVAGAGILYIGADMDLGALFAGMPVVAVWLAVAGLVGVVRPGATMSGSPGR